MKTIRFNTFETNSSSTHSLIIMTPEQMDRLDIDYFIYDDEIITSEQAEKIWDDLIEKYSKENPEEFEGYTIEEKMTFLKDYYYDYPKTVEEWAGDHETDSYTLKTPGGEIISILVYHGYDG